MKFLILENNEVLGGLNLKSNPNRKTIREQIEDFFVLLTKDFFENHNKFKFLGLENKFIEIDLWNKCSVNCNKGTEEKFELWIFGDDGLIHLEIKPLNSVKFFEVIQ